MSKTSAVAARASASSHFELFGLAPAYALDLARLDAAYREIQARVHPDRYAQAGDAERRASMQMTVRVNEAYRALKDPVQRAKHLLELNGVDVAFETDTAMPRDFLVRQMELRERLEEAKDAAALDRILGELNGEKRKIEDRIGTAIDRDGDLEKARTLARELMFFGRLGAEIDAAYEALEG